MNILGTIYFTVLYFLAPKSVVTVGCKLSNHLMNLFILTMVILFRVIANQL